MWVSAVVMVSFAVVIAIVAMSWVVLWMFDVLGWLFLLRALCILICELQMPSLLSWMLSVFVYVVLY